MGTLRSTGFDGAPWFTSGRWPLLSGSVALDVSPAAFGLDGTVTAHAFGDGPLRLQGNGRWHERTIDIASLRAWLPRSSLSLVVAGSAKFVGPAPELALTGDWTALRWPLAGEASVESALVTVTVTGALPYAFEVQAHARVTGVPEAQLNGAGTVDREQHRERDNDTPQHSHLEPLSPRVVRPWQQWGIDANLAV